jgi:hypothetical protein
MGDVRRYDADRPTTFHESADGYFVSYADYDALLRVCERLIAGLDEYWVTTPEGKQALADAATVLKGEK